ncbi:MAG: F0F1 ATP synthase subunit A [Cytophagales bacterium]
MVLSKIARSSFKLFLALYVSLFFGVSSSFATESHGQNEVHKEEAFDATKVIFEHIGDSHDWHLWGEHEHAVSIPLPVILYSSKRGIVSFLSSEFHHGTADFGPYFIEHEHIGSREQDEVVYDFSITKNVASMFLSIVIILSIFFTVASKYKTNKGVPSGIQSIFEPIICFVRDDIAKPNISHNHEKFVPFLLTIFFFIWINNLLGLLPIGANLTGNIAFTFVMAIIVFIATNLNGNKDYWAHIFWMPGLSWPMKLFMAPIELIGIFTKPFALMVRLFANITAGHIVVISLISLIFIFKSAAMSVAAIPLALFIDVLELLVAFLQAFVFTMLTALFIGSATAEHHHHDEHAHH